VIRVTAMGRGEFEIAKNLGCSPGTVDHVR
jgi:DNA-binding CsgD family transcriptional regulator